MRSEDGESVCCLHHVGLIIEEHGEDTACDFISNSENRSTVCLRALKLL